MSLNLATDINVGTKLEARVSQYTSYVSFEISDVLFNYNLNNTVRVIVLFYATNVLFSVAFVM